METLIPAAAQQIAEYGTVFTMFVIIVYVLVKAIKILFDRNQVMGDAFLKALVDNTSAITFLTEQIERMNNDRKN